MVQGYYFHLIETVKPVQFSDGHDVTCILMQNRLRILLDDALSPLFALAARIYLHEFQSGKSLR